MSLHLRPEHSDNGEHHRHDEPDDGGSGHVGPLVADQIAAEQRVLVVLRVDPGAGVGEPRLVKARKANSPGATNP